MDWIVQFNSKRTIRLGRQRTEIKNGLPQGGGLSPTLFNIYTVHLHDLADENCKIFQFADDFFITTFYSVFVMAEELLRGKFFGIQRQMPCFKSRYKCLKTNAIHFSRRPKRIDVTIDGVLLNQPKDVKFLGIVIVQNGSQKGHIDSTVLGVDRMCSFVKIVSGCRFGIDSVRALTFYRAFVRSRVEYGASAVSSLTKWADERLRKCLNVFFVPDLGSH